MHLHCFSLFSCRLHLLYPLPPRSLLIILNLHDFTCHYYPTTILSPNHYLLFSSLFSLLFFSSYSVSLSFILLCFFYIVPCCTYLEIQRRSKCVCWCKDKGSQTLLVLLKFFWHLSPAWFVWLIPLRTLLLKISYKNSGLKLIGYKIIFSLWMRPCLTQITYSLQVSVQFPT